jgi:DNA-binding MarR family transcriptional regulator
VSDAAPPGPPGAGGPPAEPDAAGHPTSTIDETVHQRHRLGILTITAEAQRAEFGYLRQALALTPGNLSRHLTVLEDADLVEVEKGYAGRRPRTWVRITPRGRAALVAELRTLTELVRRHESSATAANDANGSPAPPGA